ncbi:XRE family transcriptional regulator [Hymenobacter glacieicola]|uniref:HTH cro/C1-type domain-containing protein n=1 Tax=Hymenobacter glacieicola TaxID=1562124 RepID=A0ABQ1WL23_9BACT|nr:S24 family peptidase [Hymenobacter glacieicola]GGG33201.1 hypothetical protein GCM10011378_07020 [Hymenobacter glacieicola]
MKDKHGIGGRLYTLRDWCRLTQTQMAEKLDISRSGLSQIEKGITAPSLDIIMKVVSKFDINYEWLMDGTGMIFKYTNPDVLNKHGILGAEDANMGLDKGTSTTFSLDVNGVLSAIEQLPDSKKDELKGKLNQHLALNGSVDGSVDGSVESADKTKGTKNTDVLVPFEVRTHPLLVTVDNAGNENITMVSTAAVAGYPSHYMEPEYIRDLPAFSLPGSGFRNATFRCFQVRGNSMAPTFHQDDWVIASYVDNWPQNIKNGYIYVVVTPETVYIKRLINRILDRQSVVIQSDNEEYDTQEIHALDVLEIWYVKARLSFKFPNTRFAAHRRLGELEADVSYLMEEMRKLRKEEPKNPV